MAALDFPASPTLNQIYTANGKSWIWDGTAWNPYGGGISTLPIANGGTGQTTQTAAFDALAPTTTKGDIIVHNGTDNVRVPVGATNGHVLTVDSAEASGVKWAAGGGGGKVAQVVVATTNTPGVTTSVIPYDDTIPQNTEGAEFITATITPTNASSNLIVEFDAWGSCNALTGYILALFRDSTANAIQANIHVITTANFSTLIRIKVIVAAGSTSATTFKVRYGPTSAASAYILRTGLVSSAFDNSDSASLTVTEIIP